MKKILAMVLAVAMLFAVAATALADAPASFLWDDFNDYEPNVNPGISPAGVNCWWRNEANLRAKNDDGALKLDMRPKAYDPEDYESEDEYWAMAGDWMANWGEACNMWAMEGISTCKYLTIRVKGEVGGEEAKLVMDWHPEDSKFYAARFADLVLADGTHPVITTEYQDLVIDLEASGFPGMTNALHIRAFAKCIIWLDNIEFSEPVEVIDVGAGPLNYLTAEETGRPAELPIKDFVAELGEE